MRDVRKVTLYTPRVDRYATGHRAAIRCPVRTVYTYAPTAGADRWSTTEPTDRREWTGGPRETWKDWDTGETWQPMTWRLPAGRGFVAGYHNPCAGCYILDGRTFDDADDAERAAKDTARQAADANAEDRAEYDAAWTEGHKAGTRGVGPDDNPCCPDYAEVWEDARATAYAEAAASGGRADGRDGRPADARAWPHDTAAYRNGFREGRQLLADAAARAVLAEEG